MEQRSPDQLVEWAYDQFLEQAADMLAPEQIVDITLEFEQRGAVEATLPNADWSTELGVPVDMERWAEVWSFNPKQQRASNSSYSPLYFGLSFEYAGFIFRLAEFVPLLSGKIP